MINDRHWSSLGINTLNGVPKRELQFGRPKFVDEFRAPACI